MFKQLILGSLILMLSACATQRFDIAKGEKKTMPTYEGKHHFIFWGLGQEKVVDPLEACREGDTVESVDTHITFVDGLLEVLTFGIYYPRSYTVYCSHSKK